MTDPRYEDDGALQPGDKGFDVETRTAGRVRVNVDEMISDLQAEKAELENEIQNAFADRDNAVQRARVARDRINTIKRILSAVRGRPEPKAKPAKAAAK